MDKQELKNEIERTGKSLQALLDSHFKQWQTGLPFKTVLSPYSTRAKTLGFGGVSELAQELEKQGFIKVLSSPSGKRFVFSTKCSMSKDEIHDWLQTQELMNETEREMKKLSKHA